MKRTIQISLVMLLVGAVLLATFPIVQSYLKRRAFLSVDWSGTYAAEQCDSNWFPPCMFSLEKQGETDVYESSAYYGNRKYLLLSLFFYPKSGDYHNYFLNNYAEKKNKYASYEEIVRGDEVIWVEKNTHNLIYEGTRYKKMKSSSIMLTGSLFDKLKGHWKTERGYDIYFDTDPDTDGWYSFDIVITQGNKETSLFANISRISENTYNGELITQIEGLSNGKIKFDFSNTLRLEKITVTLHGEETTYNVTYADDNRNDPWRNQVREAQYNLPN